MVDKTSILTKLQTLSPERRALLAARLNRRNEKDRQLKLIPAAVRSGPLPLSYAQQRLWFLEQLAPGTVVYSVPAGVRLLGNLRLKPLRKTLDQIVKRHEVLRTVFMNRNGEPVQVIREGQEMQLPVVDLGELGGRRGEEVARELAGAEAQRGFDLARGPLLRATLLRLGEEDHVLLFTMHHIVSDGWSAGVLVREVSALYGAYLRGEESPLEPLGIQYVDYAVWQRGWLQGEVLER